MATYKLNLSIGEDDVRQLNNLGRKIVIVKCTEEDTVASSGEIITGVAWITFKPWQQTLVKWQNSFAVYASDTDIQSGATITTQAIRNAVPSVKLYSFTPNNIFEESSKLDTHDNTYYVNNNCGDNEVYTFGLAQSVTVQNKHFDMNPINAVHVLNKDHAYFTPIEKVKIFIQSNARDSKVITVTQTDTLEVDMTKKPEAFVRYDRDLNKFVLE